MLKLFNKIKNISIKLITALIFPLSSQKKTRKHLRNLLIEGGIFATIKCLLKLRKKAPENFQHYLSVVCCVKDEAPYILEWIEYHLLQGVDHFYVYNNNGSDNTEELLKPYIDKGLITWHIYPGLRKQKEIYNHAIQNYKNQSRWMAFIDVDEFIVPKNNQKLSDIIRNHEDKNQIIIHWVQYGTSNHQYKTDGLVIERFTMHQTGVHKQTKAIVNPRKVVSAGVHFHPTLGKEIDLNKTDSSNELNTNIIQINHYCVKSVEEFKIKQNKGRATSVGKITSDWFELNNRNEENDDLMAQYVPILKERLSKITR